MNNKEKIKNFLQNCTERQFKAAQHRYHYPVDIYALEFYDHNDQLCRLKRIIVYDDNIKNRKLVKDVFFISEEDERKFLFEGYGLSYFYCTPEYGKYLFDKYQLNERIDQISPTIYMHKLLKENRVITSYSETRKEYLRSSSWIEEYKNWRFDLNHQLNFTYVKLEENEGND